MSDTTNPTHIRVARRSAACLRVTFNNPPINPMGLQLVKQLQAVIDAIEADKDLKVVFFDSAVPAAELEAFVGALATRIARPSMPAIADTKQEVNTSPNPDIDIGARWDACIASPGWPAARDGIKTLTARGFCKPEDVGNRPGFHLGQIAD